jgi:hypothetical protein
MDTCSYFIKDKALFGSYPSEMSVKELEDHGVRYFVNLTYADEDKIKEYHTNYQIITYNIKDRSVPHDLLTFTQFISHLADIIKQLKISEKIYIHCKGGHGRSGLVVACLICYIFKLSPYEALNYTSKCHSNRSVMRDKWRKIGAPQTHLQKKFVHQLFRPINYARMFKGHFAYHHDNVITEELNLKDYYKNKIDTNEEMRDFLLHTYMKPIVSYDNSHISKEICEILTDIRQNLYCIPI